MNDLHYYLNQPLEFIELSSHPHRIKPNYPIGKIGDIEIQFMHYSSQAEAYEKWNRRLERFNFSRVLLKHSCDKDEFSGDHLLKFENANFSGLIGKVCLSAKPRNFRWIVCKENLPEDGGLQFRYCQDAFDIVRWLNDGTVSAPNFLLQRINSILCYTNRFDS